MLDERESLRDKVYTLAEGGHSLFDEKGDSDWDTIDDNWVEYQKRYNRVMGKEESPGKPADPSTGRYAAAKYEIS